MPIIPFVGLTVVATLVAVTYVITRTLTPDDSAPQSESYRAYRATMRSRLKVAFLVPVAAAVVGAIYGIIATALDPTNPSPTYRPVSLVLGLLWWPGIFLFPLLAMLLTEKTTRPSGPRVATLAPRGVRELFPRWLLIAFGSVFAIAALTPLILGSPIAADRTLRSASNPPTHEYSVDPSGMWIAYGTFLIAAVFVLWVILSATRRPDIDPITGSDSWGRSGTSVRALCLLYIPATYVIIDGLEIPRDAAMAYVDHTRAGGEAVDGWPLWLNSTTIPHITDGISALLMLGIVVVLVVFARPPVPRALTAAAARSADTREDSDDEATAQ
ncbi:hypothetical protein [Tsukamurella paurometabola]|uniref:Uncharacterized protein n=1 Tax=Tsukamurella paurometabola TaxID=2061 RepID=A0A3P8K0G5_TSUPA|nr:hypothetical protein [Tsukamurella paurometabola]UEA81971.1 hypothetical protein LK411_16510 [Tsukamurella paurometabola]VDR38999.1 Uncharacterised protein [Tsukamurella paurometabola]